MKYIASLFTVSLASSLYAQNIEKNLPREFDTQSTGEVVLTEESDVLSEENDRVLIDTLNGLSLVDARQADDESAKSDAPVQVAPGLLIAGDAALLNRLSGFLGSEITFADISAIKLEVYTVYRNKGFPVVDISVPEQEITDGRLSLTVTESFLGAVEVDGGHYLNGDRKVKQIRHSLGEPINVEMLQKDIDWINRDPFASADLILSSGEAFGESDLSLVLSDEYPVYGYFGYENTGNDVTGLDRYFVGGSWGNVFNLGHQVSYQYTTSGDMDELSIHSTDYKVRLPWRDELVVSGIYAESEADIEGTPFSEDGESWYLGIRYWTSLPDLYELTHSLTFGFDFKQTNNDLEFGGTSVQDSKFDILQWLIRYNASLADDWGTTELTSTVFYSPGNLTDNNEDDIFAGDAEYIYGFLELSRVTYLPFEFLLNSTVSGQVSDSSLFTSEQFGLGGFNTVRGYDYREVNGDEGYLVNMELRSPTMNSQQLLKKLSSQAEVQFLAFWDFGYSRIKDPDIFEIPETYMASYGMGLRATITKYMQASVDYGWQLRDIDSAAGDDRFHLNVTMIF